MIMGTGTCVPNIQKIRYGRLKQRVDMNLMRQLCCWNCRLSPQKSTLVSLKAFDPFMLRQAASFLEDGRKSQSCFSVSATENNRSCCPFSASPSDFRHRGLQFFCSSSTGIKQVEKCLVPCSSYSKLVGPFGPPSWPNVVRSPDARFLSGLGRPSGIALAPRTTSFLPDKDWVESQRLCPGCGVEMQDEDPKAPGFFQQPAESGTTGDDEGIDDDDSEADVQDVQDGMKAEEENEETDRFDTEFEFEDDGNFSGAESSRRGKRGREKRQRSSAKQGAKSKMGSDEGPRPTVCARCHALRNYGKVKDESVENLLPDFDFEHVVGTRLRKAVGRRAVVLMVVDAVDFDGTFPRMAAALLADTERELSSSWEEGKAANVPRLIVVVNKVDLLPSQVSPVRLDQWARRRSRAGGATHISGMHVVSAFRGWGIDKLCKQIAELAGPRGDVWVIGAQNVGKSSLINALGKFQSEKAEKKTNVYLTEAARPGTTLGVLKLEGILPGKARLHDTPGLLHPHQITNRLTGEEQKMIQVRKILKPRTFRVKVGHAISVGGLMRMTVIRAPAESIYATVWASPFITCHLGKAESAQDLFDRHIGEKLQPPLDKERLGELGRWMARRVEVFGEMWNKSSVDVAVAGVGWIALALSGSAVVEIWTYDGVAVTVRDAMVLDLAAVMERPGFTALKSSGKGKK